MTTARIGFRFAYRLFGLLLVGVGLSHTLATVAAWGGQRPNVLFIAIEDASPKRFGCYGNPVCKTPNLDKFAATGLRFDACHTYPPCCPSRTTMLLGLRPPTTHVFGNRSDWRQLCPGATTMPARFRQNGYETIRCGKIFHDSFEDKASWDSVIREREGMPRPRHKRRALDGPARDATREQLATSGTPFLYGPTGLDDLEETDGMLATQAVRVLDNHRQSDTPWLLALGFHAPHLPFAAPDKYVAMYPADQMTIPHNPDALPNGMPPKGPRWRVVNPHTLDQWRHAIACHYATITFVDAQIGRVLDALHRFGLDDNTIVVIWTDHGFMLGEHWLWRKGPMYNESTQCVLLWRAPGVTQAGSVCRRPVEPIDIFPTLMELCGMTPPRDIEAISMVRLLNDPQRHWKKGVLMSSGNRVRSIVTDEYRYTESIRHPGTGRQLFDHGRDPGEFHNVVDDPAYADTAKRLQALLHGGWKACLPD